LSQQLMLFEGQHEVMILLKEDVKFSFYGDFLILAKNVAAALEYARTEEVTKFCKAGQVFIVKNSDISASALNRIRKLNNAGEAFITNLALNRVLGKSEKPKAEPFQDWLYEDMLPTVQKTGGYVANEDLFIQTYLPYADEQTKMTFRATLALVRKQNEQIAFMKPKADYFDALVDRNLLTNFRDTAKELKIGPKAFVNWLLEKRYVYRDQKGRLKPYAEYVPELFNLKEWERNGKADTQTLITPRGRETFRLLLGNYRSAIGEVRRG